jgi:hypothetical protein
MRSHRCKTLNKALEIQKTESLRPIYEEQDTLMNNKTNITASSQPYTDTKEFAQRVSAKATLRFYSLWIGLLRFIGSAQTG